MLDSSISSKLFFLEIRQGPCLTDPVLLQGNTLTKLTLFILDSSISSKMFFLEVQQGSSLIDPFLERPIHSEWFSKEDRLLIKAHEFSKPRIPKRNYM